MTKERVEELKTVEMQGLRVYIKRVDADTNGERGVFYSRRDDGPYYRWRYEAQLGQWCGSRLRTSDLIPHAFCLARWKSVPLELQTSLVQHYLE